MKRAQPKGPVKAWMIEATFPCLIGRLRVYTIAITDPDHRRLHWREWWP